MLGRILPWEKSHMDYVKKFKIFRVKISSYEIFMWKNMGAVIMSQIMQGEKKKTL